MKSVLIGLMLTIGLSAFANTVESVYKKDSVLPSELKQQIIQYVIEKCPQDISSYGLSEVQTQVIDKADIDYAIETTYETTFVSRYYFDGMHPSNQEIKVTSIQKKFQGTGYSEFLIERVMTETGCEQ